MDTRYRAPRVGTLAWEGGGRSGKETRAGGREHGAGIGPAAVEWREATRRAVELVLSAVGLVLASPLLAAIAVAIKIDSPGPVFYRQIRVGRDRRNGGGDDEGGGSRRTGDLGGRPFVIYKFRTMHVGAERGQGPVWATEEDDRTTRVGRFLRRYSLDELPQLWNVLKGDMSLVGPRPERPSFVTELRNYIPEYRLRQKVRPGMTGWAQVHQGSDSSVEDVRRKVRYDLEYLENRSLSMDLSIMLRTPLIMMSDGFGDGGSPDDPAGTSDPGTGRRAERADTQRHHDEKGEGEMNAEASEVESAVQRVRANSSDRTLVLLASSRKWLRMALGEVLSPEGFRLVSANDPDDLRRRAEEESPAVVIVDEELPGLDVEAAARELVEGPLGRGTPLLLYTSSSVAGGGMHARALNAGFWSLLREPVRAAPVIAELRRLLAIADRIRGGASTQVESTSSRESSVGFLTLDELGRVLPAIGALAERQETTVSLLLLGPTSEADDPEDASATASICGPNLRRADLCALIDGAEVAVVAYDTGSEGARALFERLDQLAAERPDLEEKGGLSAGIVELKPSRDLERALSRAGRGAREELGLDEIVEIFHLSDARSALQDARESGGGVRVIEVA